MRVYRQFSVLSGWCPDSDVRIICSTLVCELRNRKDTSKLLVLVRLWFRSPHDERAARMMRTSEPPHERRVKPNQRKKCKSDNALLRNSRALSKFWWSDSNIRTPFRRPLLRMRGIKGPPNT